MAQKTRTILKSYYQTGEIPSENNYADLIDSFSHLGEANTGDLKLTGSFSLTGSEAHIDVGGSQGDLIIKGNISGSKFVNVSGSNTHPTASTTPVGGYHIDYYGDYKNSLTRGRLELQPSGGTSPLVLETLNPYPSIALDTASANNTYLKVPGAFHVLLTGSGARHGSHNKFIVSTQDNPDPQVDLNYDNSFPLLRISSSGNHMMSGSLTITGSDAYGIGVYPPHPLFKVEGAGGVVTSILPGSMSMQAGATGDKNISISGFDGSITASGNISSSGTVTCTNIFTDGSINVGSELNLAGDVTFTLNSGLTGSITTDAGNNYIRCDKGLAILLGREMSDVGKHMAPNYHGFRLFRARTHGINYVGTNTSWPEAGDPMYHHTFPDTGTVKIFDVSQSGSIHQVTHITASGNIWVTSSIDGPNPYGIFLSTAGNITASGNISASGNGTFTGTIAASNLSGTNTGDQDLSSYLLSSNTASFAVTSSNVLFGNVTASNIMVGNNGNIYHDQNTKDTYIGFEDDEINFVLGGQQFLMLDEQGATDTIKFGTAGHDVDFQVSNDGTANSIKVMGDTGFVGINKSVPTAQFHVNGTVLFENLPTSDPSTAGQLWNSASILKISEG